MTILDLLPGPPLDAILPQMPMFLMKGVRDLMDSLNGWQTLEEIDGTPLLHTG